MNTYLDVEKIKQALSPLKVLSDNESLEKYGGDHTRIPSAPTAIVFPETVEQVQQVVRFAVREKIAITPSGGRTGLTGAATATSGELVVVLDKMNNISNFNPVEKTITCGPGVILQVLHEYTQSRGYFYPVSLAAKGSCQVGGNISTNAGGINVIRYGGTRQWVAGLKVVTGTGDLLSLNESGLIKNNTGYPLHELFIGAEGTLGIIVEAVLRVTRLPRQLKVMVLGHRSLEHVLETLTLFQKKMDVLAFETFDQKSVEKVMAANHTSQPLGDSFPFYSLIEFECETPEKEEEVFSIFERGLDKGWIIDGIMSQNEAQREQLWKYREDISESLWEDKPYKYDISVPVARIPEFHGQASQLLSESYPELEAVWFGHAGDGNLHLDILKPGTMDLERFHALCAGLSPELFSLLGKINGSISAEHGIGLLKKPYLSFSRSQAEIGIMKQIKKIFDPANIMNPGKIFD